MKFHSKPIYDEKYKKAKVKTFNTQLIQYFGMMKFHKKMQIILAQQQ